MRPKNTHKMTSFRNPAVKTSPTYSAPPESSTSRADNSSTKARVSRSSRAHCRFTDPHVNPRVFSSARDMKRLREELNEAKHKDSYCHLCSEEGAIFHPHFSTQYMRVFGTKYRSTNTYHCPMCKKEEPILLPENQTRRLILSSSILYNVWENHTLQLTQHIDMEAIVGGRVRDLTRALRHLYLDKPNRLEIVAMVSINNIGEGQSPEQIIQEMKDMKELVKEHSIYYKIDPPSYVSSATCILPPKFCSFSVPRDAPGLAEWIPSPNFINKAAIIERLNDLIKELNGQDNIQYVGLHLQGMKFFRSGKKQHKFDTKEGAQKIWREKDVFRKLHFTQEIKAKIVGFAINCFEQNSQEKEQSA